MRVYEVHWVDSTSIGGWETDGEVVLINCKTVGYLIKKDRDKIVLAQSNTDSGAPYYNKFAIPRGCITKIEVIK